MPRIERVTARRLWDGNGQPTLEAEVWLRSGVVGRAVAAQPTRILGGGAVELRDGGRAFGGAGVTAAVMAVREDVAAALHGCDARDQAAIDRALIATDGTPDKSRLGGNALIAVSLAVARAAALATGQPLWQRLAGGSEPAHVPRPIVEVLARPSSRPGSPDEAPVRSLGFASLGAVATGAETLAQALDWSAEVARAVGDSLARLGGGAGMARGGAYLSPVDDAAEALDLVTRAIARAGFAVGEDVSLALDVGAGLFGSGGRYVVPGEAGVLDARAMVEMQLGWLGRFALAVVEDPLAPDGGAAWPALTRGAGAGVAVVGGDLLVSDSRRVALAAEAGACNAVRIEPQQAGTLTEARAALDQARAAGWRVLVGGGSGCGDVWPAEVAVGWGADLIRVGGLGGGTAALGLNELIRIAGRLPNGGKLRPW